MAFQKSEAVRPTVEPGQSALDVYETVELAIMAMEPAGQHQDFGGLLEDHVKKRLCENIPDLKFQKCQYFKTPDCRNLRLELVGGFSATFAFNYLEDLLFIPGTLEA